MLSAKDGFNSFKSRWVRPSEHNASRDDHRNLSSVGCGTDQSEFGSDACSPFAHSLQPEMSILSLICDNRGDADPIVTHTHCQILRVSDLDLQATRLRVRAGVSDCFIPNAIDLITDDRVQVLGIANHRK